MPVRLGPRMNASRATTPVSTAPTLQYAKDQDISAREDLKKKGVQIHQLQDLEEMKKKMAPLIEQYAKKSPLIDAFIKAAQA